MATALRNPATEDAMTAPVPASPSRRATARFRVPPPVGWLLSVVAFGAWLCVERGVFVTHAPAPGGADAPWAWTHLAGRPGAAGEVLLSGLGFAVLLLLASRLPGWLGAGRASGPAHGATPAATALPLLLAELVAWPLMQVLLPRAPAHAWAELLVLAAGRVCVLAALWQALRVDQILAAFPRLPRRPALLLLGVLAVLPPVAMRGVPLHFTGDEPSYLQAADSLVRRGSLAPTDAEADKMNKALDIDRGLRPHRFVRADGTSAPLHFTGPSLGILPAYVAGRATGHMPAAVNGFMLVVFGATIALLGVFALRVTGLPGPSVAAAAVFAVSFPWLGLSYQVYPEPFVSLLLLAALCAMAPLLRAWPSDGAPLAPRALAVVAVGCVLLPWFHPRYGALSLALALMTLAWGRLSPRRVLAVSAGVAAAAAVFLAFHLAVFGDVMWRQNSGHFAWTGVLGMLVDSENGLLAFAPWLLLAPAGVAALRARPASRGGAARMVVAVLSLGLPLYLVTALSTTWNDGGTSAVRYFSPLLVACAPLVAAALGVLRARALPVVLLLWVPLLAAGVFVRDPVSGYHTGGQNARTVLDTAVAAFSWRELFPHLPYRDYGTWHGRPLVQAVVVLVAAGALGWWLRRRRTPAGAAAAFTGVLAVLALAAAGTGSMNHGVTLVRGFERKVTRLGFLERHESRRLDAALERLRCSDPGSPRAMLVLPVSVKPLERLHPGRRMADGPALVFTPGNAEGALVGGLVGRLPRGIYRLRVEPGVLAPEGGNGVMTLEARTQVVMRDEPARMTEVTGAAVRELTTGGTGEVVCEFAIQPWPRDCEIVLSGHGTAGLVLRHVVIEYLRRE